jgi:lysophospholipase L1-like esterase
MRIKFLYVYFLLLLCIPANATEFEPFFKQSDRVCFVGNSITNNGEFHHNILLFHITRFPHIPATVYNCGVSGDNTERVIRRMENDILVNKPTKAIIMLGMNDVSRHLYSEKPTANAWTLRQRTEAIDIYKANYEKIVLTFLSKNISVVLQTPSIYDQTAILATPNNFGANDALKQCADFIQLIAEKYQLVTVDYWSIMTTINAEIQKKDSTATLTSKDRIHPQSTGHFIMYYQFLKTMNAPKFVSKIVVNKNAVQSSKQSLNCNIESLEKTRNQLKFVVKENALPFPMVETYSEGAKLVPFVVDFNNQILQVGKMPGGNYQLIIDDTLIGEFSHAALKEGINLTLFQKTPQYLQALQVRDVLKELWQLESGLRGLKFIEVNRFFQESPDKNNAARMKERLYPLFEKSYPSNSAYYKSQLDKYFQIKPLEQEYLQKSDVLRLKAFELAQPKFHTFIIKRKYSNS